MTAELNQANFEAVEKGKREGKFSSHTTASQRAKMDAGAAKTFQLMQKHNVDPEKMSDKEMEDLVKKWVASGELKMSDLGGMPGASASFEEDEKDAKDVIGDKISAYIDKIQELNIQGVTLADILQLRNKLNALYEEIQTSWIGSDAYKQVYDIEKDIDARAWEYIEKHEDYGNNGAVIEYPPFWVEGRKKENAIIKQFNLEQAGKWRNMLQGYIDTLLPTYQEAAELETELNAAFTDKTDALFPMYKANLANSVAALHNALRYILDYAYDVPVVYGVDESNQIGQ